MPGNLTLRNMVAVNYVGDDSAGVNPVGAPWSRLTIAAALADLSANYPAGTASNPHVVALGPGVFTTPAFALPPFTYIQGTADSEGRAVTTISLTGDVTLDATWAAAATNGGFTDCIIRAGSGTPHLDFTLPAPSSGNPTRVIRLRNVVTDLDLLNFQATGTGDAIGINDVRHDGNLTQNITLQGGTQTIDNLDSNATVTLSSTAAQAATVRGINSRFAALVLTKGAAAMTNSFDSSSVPVIANFTANGGAVYTRLNDAYSEAYTPTTPGDWSPVPTTVQGALDTLGASGGGGSNTFLFIVRTGNRSSAAWGVNGVTYNDTANTFTDTSSSGVVAGPTVARSFAIPTYAASSATTYTDAANFYIAGAPAAGANVTITRGWAMYIAAANVFFAGALYLGTTTGGNLSGSAGSVICAPGTTGKFFVNNTASNQPGIVLKTTDSAGNGSIRWQNSTGTAQAGIACQFNISDAGGLEFLNASTTNMRLTSGGNLLLGGTTNGTGQFQLLSTSGTAAGGTVYGSDTYFYRTNAGQIALENPAGAAVLSWKNTGTIYGQIFTFSTNFKILAVNSLLLDTANGTTAVTLSATQQVRFNAYGAGAITSDASGNLTAVSDARYKDITGSFGRGLVAIRAISPKLFRWNKASGLSMTEINAGFIAQEVIDHIPEAIGKNREGFYTFHDRPITAALVNAVKELADRLELLEKAA